MVGRVAQQVLIDLRGVGQSVCLDVDAWEHAFAIVSASLGARVISKYGHRFDPPAEPGLTVYFLLDASHLSVHTYADEGKAAVDLFACTDADVGGVADQLLSLLEIDHSSVAKRTTLRRFDHE